MQNTAIVVLCGVLAAALGGCSCADVHEIDRGPFFPDGAPSSPFLACGNPRAPLIQAASCTPEAQTACHQWASSFGVSSGLVDGHCERSDPSPAVPAHYDCYTGAICHHDGPTWCECSPGEECSIGQICAQDTPTSPWHCVQSCADLSRCFPAGHAPGGLWVQGPYCPTDGGVGRDSG